LTISNILSFVTNKYNQIQNYYQPLKAPIYPQTQQRY